MFPLKTGCSDFLISIALWLAWLDVVVLTCGLWYYLLNKWQMDSRKMHQAKVSSVAVIFICVGLRGPLMACLFSHLESRRCWLALAVCRNQFHCWCSNHSAARCPIHLQRGTVSSPESRFDSRWNLPASPRMMLSLQSLPQLLSYLSSSVSPSSSYWSLFLTHVAMLAMYIRSLQCASRHWQCSSIGAAIVHE